MHYCRRSSGCTQPTGRLSGNRCGPHTVTVEDVCESRTVLVDSEARPAGNDYDRIGSDLRSTCSDSDAAGGVFEAVGSCAASGEESVYLIPAVPG